MKNFLIYLATIIMLFFLAPFYVAAITAWIWCPAIFSIFNLFGGFWLGLIIGLAVSIGTQVLIEIITNK